jgi:hypothetical protein
MNAGRFRSIEPRQSGRAARSVPWWRTIMLRKSITVLMVAISAGVATPAVAFRDGGGNSDGGGGFNNLAGRFRGRPGRFHDRGFRNFESRREFHDVYPYWYGCRTNPAYYYQCG